MDFWIIFFNFVNNFFQFFSPHIITPNHQNSWDEAILKCTSEIHRLGHYGLTTSEFDRYKEAILADASQLAAQGDTLAHGDVINFLMEGVACGHTQMVMEDSFVATEVALACLTLEEANLEVCVFGFFFYF